MMNVKETVFDALEMARKAGASQSRIALEKNTENSATVINGKVDKLLSCFDSTMYVQLFIDGRYGSFSTNMLRKDELRKFINASAEATRLITIDPCRRLPDPELCFHGPAKDLKQYDRRVEFITTEERIARAMAASTEIWGRNRSLLEVETEWGDDTEYAFTADSQGFCGESLISNHTISASVSVKGRGDEKPESWWYESGIYAEDAKVEGCSSKALQRALNLLDAKKIKSGRYNAVIESTVSSKLVAPLIKALNGGYIQQENSFLAGSIGKKIFGGNLTLTDEPHTEGLPGSRLFDGDGIATKNRTVINGGIVENWFISSYYGLKMGMPPTVDSPSVLRFAEFGEKRVNLQALLEEAGSGILVTDFNGGNCNSATGDFSYGVTGFLFKNGELLHPVREMNMTGNMVRLWSSLLAAGCDRRKCSRWGLPSLAFEGIDFSGI